MNLNTLASEITKREGKRLSLSVAQVKEVVGLLADACFADAQVVAALVAAGKRRADSKGRARKKG